MVTESPLVRFILMKFDELVGLVSGLDDETANATLPVEGSNSASTSGMRRSRAICGRRKPHESPDLHGATWSSSRSPPPTTTVPTSST